LTKTAPAEHNIYNMKTVDKYLFQALDNYPYNLEEVVESLDYALSYNSKNTMALCLYGRVYAEQLSDYEQAKLYFQEALTLDVFAKEVYSHYIQTLILNEDFEEATKLIDFALTIKGIDKVEILMKKTTLFEKMHQFKKGLKMLKEVKLCILNSDYNYLIEETEKRLKQKVGKDSSKKKDKKKK
jgi:tetratricopeptide (TPR) repeat protein